MPRSRYKVTQNNSPYFITCSIVNWLPLFANPTIANIIFHSLRFLQNEKRLSIHAYVLMENHLHLIASSASLEDEMRNFKSFTAKKCIDYYQKKEKSWVLKQLSFNKQPHKVKQQFQFWQEGYHPKLIEHDQVLTQKLDYIHNNPVERGYIDDPVHWRYSSWRNFMGLEAMLEIEKL